MSKIIISAALASHLRRFKAGDASIDNLRAIKRLAIRSGHSVIFSVIGISSSRFRPTWLPVHKETQDPSEFLANVWSVVASHSDVYSAFACVGQLEQRVDKVGVEYQAINEWTGHIARMEAGPTAELFSEVHALSSF